MTLSHRDTVTPEQVTEPAIPGPSFLVIDCPTKKYISSITGNQCFKEYQTDGDNKATLVVHMADKDIIADSSYQSWISSATATALLDCGEGTYGQIVNHYGDEADEMIKRLKFVFISHLHADHHLGLIRILKLRQKLLKKTGSSYVPPLVAAPRNLSIWLKEYSSACESVQFRFADCKGLVSNNSKHSLLQDISEIFKVIITPVDHHTEAYGIALCHNDGWKITYSGDTEPCQSLVDAGKDSTLLIHEATFEDGLEEDAKEKHHSTCGQALEIAEQMKAKNVLLTHFSQRYSKLPVMKNETPVAVAFDHMEVHPDDIPEISKLLPKLQVLFQEDDKMK
eukprot:Seg2506.4 transcript_id=Seg2506.4/GoldUCD/mRNA.D3Y31 product="Zinc phosphodiesterase ELAC protein 2" protein_id=Seg2506.4/GoldUCD/D3Y31